MLLIIGTLGMVSTRLRKWLQVLDVAKELELPLWNSLYP